MPPADDPLPNVSIALARLLDELGDLRPLAQVAQEEGLAPPPAGAATTVDADRTWLPPRYEDISQLGMGGMGEVRRVLDRHLNRPVAMKIVRPSLVYSPEALARFLEEAQIAAQLEHPSIIPVYEAGKLDDGRLYFTMKEVHGRTLDEVCASVHAASTDDRWGTSDDGWTLRRLIDAFGRVCSAMAYAHARGVIHRDLKPENVMVGAFGEVLVLDWGIGKVLNEPPRPSLAVHASGPVRTERSEGALFQTQMGDVGGTPAYMPPEQAQGRVSDLGPRTDVYALGAILFHLLSGGPPYPVGSIPALLRAQEEGLPPPPGRVVGEAGLVTARGGRPIPEDLWAICCRALAFEAEARHADAGELADEVADWLEGARRRERAMTVIREADDLAPRIRRLRERAQELRQTAATMLAEIPPLAPVRRKRPAWEREGQAERLEREADLAEERMVQSLHAALSHLPDLAEAHARLARYYKDAHVAAEAAGDQALAARLEIRLRAHDDGEHRDYLAGDGSLTLLTEPPGAEVLLRPFQEKDRRLAPGDPRVLGRTPLFAKTLPMGGYMVELVLPGHERVLYPVDIRRQEHWHGVEPGASAPRPILLPPEGAIGEREVYVPAGWTHVGGDPEATRGLDGHEVWMDGFVIQAFPVTNQEYIVFLDDLVQRGDEALALELVPRERGARAGVPGASVYGRRADGGFELVADAEGDVWQLDWPVVLIPWDAARTYAAWLADRTGLDWRLPSELEWEKAARGPDQRIYPWGNHLDLTWCLTQDSHAGRMMPTTVQAFPQDQGPYGVRGQAGNTRDWCREADGETEDILATGRLLLQPESDGSADVLRLTRGGCWYSHHRDARVCSRVKSPQAFRAAGVGIRLVRSYG